MSRHDDLYSILGVTSQASQAEIKRAYYDLMKRVHPDQGGSEEEAKRINAAYEILGDPAARREYDSFRQGAPCPVCGRLFSVRDEAADHLIAHQLDRELGPEPPVVGRGRLFVGLVIAGVALAVSLAALASESGGIIWYGGVILGLVIAFRGFRQLKVSRQMIELHRSLRRDIEEALNGGEAPKPPSPRQTSEKPRPETSNPSIHTVRSPDSPTDPKPSTQEKLSDNGERRKSHRGARYLAVAVALLLAFGLGAVAFNAGPPQSSDEALGDTGTSTTTSTSEATTTPTSEVEPPPANDGSAWLGQSYEWPITDGPPDYSHAVPLDGQQLPDAIEVGGGILGDPILTDEEVARGGLLTVGLVVVGDDSAEIWIERGRQDSSGDLSLKTLVDRMSVDLAGELWTGLYVGRVECSGTPEGLILAWKDEAHTVSGPTFTPDQLWLVDEVSGKFQALPVSSSTTCATESASQHVFPTELGGPVVPSEAPSEWRNVDEWIGAATDSYEIEEGWSGLMVDGERTNLSSTWDYHCLDEECGWALEFWGDTPEHYVLVTDPEYKIAAALQISVASDEVLNFPCLSDELGPVVYVTDAQDAVLRSWQLASDGTAQWWAELDPGLISPVEGEGVIGGHNWRSCHA